MSFVSVRDHSEPRQPTSNRAAVSALFNDQIRVRALQGVAIRSKTDGAANRRRRRARARSSVARPSREFVNCCETVTGNRWNGRWTVRTEGGLGERVNDEVVAGQGAVEAPPWRTMVRWIVLHPNRDAVLVLDEDGQPVLPWAELSSAVWLGDAPALTGALGRAWRRRGAAGVS